MKTILPFFLTLVFAASYGFAQGIEDCNGNLIPDDVDISTGTSQDCNENGIPDECDIDDETSQDCNANDIPDECDIAIGPNIDCNNNSVPDDCDIAAGDSEDCNSNSVPDECDLDGGMSEDCNNNDVPDECELEDFDCNSNGRCDNRDIGWGYSCDENSNGIPDECEGSNLVDCNENWVCDHFEIAMDLSCDENENLIPDECEKSFIDCNQNGICDRHDLDWARGTSCDRNNNEIPDECEFGPEYCVADITCNDVVDVDDLLDLIGSWGPCSPQWPCRGDISPPEGNGVVNIDDLFLLHSEWGDCVLGPPTPATGHCENNRLIPQDISDQYWYGRSVAVDGNVAIVDGDIFERQPLSNSWIQIKDGSSPTGVVEIDGDLAIIGSGIFRRDSGGKGNWGQVSDIPGARKLDNETIIAFSQGTVRVYDPDELIPNVWVEVAQISPPEGAFEFGTDIDISGDVILVGAPQTQNPSGQYAGAAYFFERDEGGDNNWGLARTRYPIDGVDDDAFGGKVALSGSTALISSSIYPTLRDAVYVFTYDPKTGNWPFTRKLVSTPIDKDLRDGFGFSISLHGDIAVIGAVFDDDGGVNAGSARLFKRNHGGLNNWGEITYLVASNGNHRDAFGYDVATDGKTVLIGAIRHDSEGYETGTAYVYSIIVGDLTGDGRVNVDDLLQQIGQWGICPAEPACCPGDVDYNRTVNVDDLLKLIGNWGDHS